MWSCCKHSSLRRGITANGYKTTNTVFAIQRHVLHLYYLYTSNTVHSVIFCSLISTPKWAATRFGALRDIEVGHIGNACCDRDMFSIMTVCFWSTKQSAWAQKLYQDLGNRVVLCLYWAKAEQKGTSRCRSQRAPRVPPTEGSLKILLCYHCCFVLPKSVSSLFITNHAIYLFIHRFLQLWKLSFPPPKSGMEETGWAPHNQVTLRIWGSTAFQPARIFWELLQEPEPYGNLSWEQELRACLRGSRGSWARCASLKWRMKLSWWSWRGCPRDGTCISGSRWDSTLAHPSASVLQVALMSTWGHPLGHSAISCVAFVPSTSLCLLSRRSQASRHTFYHCVDSNKIHLNFGHGVQIVWNNEGIFLSVLWTIMNRFMYLFNNQSCMRCNNFQFLFLVYLPVFKKYPIKRKYCSEKRFNCNYLFIASARVYKTAFYALMLIKVLGTSPDTLIVFQSKWVSIKEISLGL